LLPVSLPFRSKVEHASYPLLERLNRLPRFAAFLGVLALMVAGVLVPRVGFVFTLMVAALVGWLVYVNWPRLVLPEKLLRIAVLFLVLAVALVQAVPR
jgi:hypothetical protein